MAKLIELSFANVSNSATYDFLGAGCVVQTWKPSYSGRVVDRPQMQAHGAVPTVPYIDKLPITVEGLLRGDTPELLMDERDSFLRAMLGNLTRRKTSAKSGTLTVQLAGWGGSGDVDVAVESTEASLVKEGVRTCDFMVVFIAFKPYALDGDLPLYL